MYSGRNSYGRHPPIHSRSPHVKASFELMRELASEMTCRDGSSEKLKFGEGIGSFLIVVQHFLTKREEQRTDELRR